MLPNLPGFLHTAGFVESVPAIFNTIYTYAWFVGLAIAGGLYTISMWGEREMGSLTWEDDEAPAALPESSSAAPSEATEAPATPPTVGKSSDSIDV